MLKASQDKKFVCEEAERTLQVMTECVPSSPLLMQLKPYVSHSNPRVRAKAASCVYRCVSKLVSAQNKSQSFIYGVSLEYISISFLSIELSIFQPLYMDVKTN